jgi:hypothetical protein
LIRLIHFPHTRDPHFICACGLPWQIQLLLS